MRRLFIPLLLIPALVVGAGKSKLFDKKLPNDKKILHALNRLSFGPRPGDVEAVRKIGLKKWVDLQLHPSQIPESQDLLARLKPLDTLQMTTQEMNRHYPTQQMLAAAARGMGGDFLPKDPVLRARTERLAEMYKRRINGETKPAKGTKTLEEILDPDQAKTLRSGTDAERFKLLMDMSEDKLTDVVAALPPSVRRPLFTTPALGLQRKLMVSATPQNIPAYDLSQAKLLRAVYSNRQLEEVLVDFWYNHFNVFIEKGNDRFLVTS
jgi:hypothetical protein